MKKFFILFLATSILHGCFWNKKPEIPQTEDQNVSIDISKPSAFKTISENENYKSFFTLIQKAKLEKVFADSPSLTVFVPTNDALQIIFKNQKTLDEFLSHPDKSEKFVKSHLLTKKIKAEKITESEEFLNGANEKIIISKVKNDIIVNGAAKILKQEENETFNIYEIDAIIFPLIQNPLTNQEELKTLAKEKSSTQQPITADKPTTISPFPETKEISSNGSSIIDILRADGRFTIFLSLLEEAKLTQALAQTPNLTIFAPTDDAFRPAIANEKTKKFLYSDPYIIPTILTTHITTGKLTLQDITSLTGIETLSGVELAIGLGEKSEIFIGAESQIIEGNLMGKNGIIHAINQVILPEIP